MLAALRDSRLVTLLGPGGIGKTRLAAVAAEAAAPSFPAGGGFVDLVPVRDGFVAAAVAGALGIPDRTPQPLSDGIVDRLRRRTALLVMDNCEHLIEEVSRLVEQVLTECPDVTVLATSRERLAVAGERTFAVPPLRLESEAELLFLDRARAVVPELTGEPATITRLCASLDGMPLAIELAAVRAGSLGLDGLNAALDDRLRLQSGGRGADERHRSMRAVIGWSHDLLDAEEQALFRRLAVFVGGFDLPAMAATNPGLRRGALADLLGRLADKSLLVHDAAGDRSRWRLLESVRAFAVERLADSDDRDEVARLHLEWAAATAAHLEGELDASWQVRFGEVVDDLRAALAASPLRPDATAHRLARGLAHLAFARRWFTEARSHYEAAAERAEDGSTAAADLRSAADAAVAVADGTSAFHLLRSAAEQARASGDRTTQAAALAGAVIAVHRYLAGASLDLPPGYTAALVREAGDPPDAHAAALVAAARAWDGGPPKRPRPGPGPGRRGGRPALG